MRNLEIEIALADQRLTELRVRDTLEDIRNNVWGEGKISSENGLVVGEGKHYRGFMIQSDPIPMFYKKGVGRGLEILNHEDFTFLEMRVIWGEQDSMALEILDLVPLINPMFRQLLLTDMVKTYGLPEGLSLMSGNSHSLIESVLTDLDEPNIQNKFLDLVAERVEARRSRLEFPKQIREYYAKSFDQIPALKANDLTRTDLLAWEAQTIGLPKFLVAAKSFFE